MISWWKHVWDTERKNRTTQAKKRKIKQGYARSLRRKDKQKAISEDTRFERSSTSRFSGF